MNILFNGGLLGREALCYQGREIVKQLDKYHDVKIDSQPVGGFWKRFYGKFKNNKPPDIYILNGHVPYLKELTKKYCDIISITVFETTIPKEWAEILNLPEIKEIWTISEFCKKLILDSGINKPVRVPYLGVDKRFFDNGVNILAGQAFKFLNISAPHCIGKVDRKGLDILINAFKEEFGDDPNVQLVLKINTIYADKLNKNFKIQEYLKSLLPKETNLSNIVVCTDYFHMEELNNLYNSVDCLVSPHRAEGFCFPVAEMMKIGKPVISTDYSATTEYTDPRLRIKNKGFAPLDYNTHPYYDESFACPDKEHLKQLMRQIYKNYEAEKKIAKNFSKSKKLAEFDWNIMGKKLDDYLKEIKKE